MEDFDAHFTKNGLKTHKKKQLPTKIDGQNNFKKTNKIMNTPYNFLSKMLFLVVLLGCAEKKEQNEEARKPNILFLFADDQRLTTINALGNNEVITPNLDELVTGGTTFNNAYIMGAMNGAVCAPSRAMLMTGRALFNIDPTGNTIDKTHTTMPKALEAGGYKTYHIGKWHNGKDAFVRSFTNGSKIFFGGMHRQYEVPTFEFSEEGDYSDANLNTPSPKHSSELYADAGVEFLESYSEEEPFFMYMAFQAPHDPREMPEAYLKKYDTANISLPPNFMAMHPFKNGELDIRDEWLAGYPRTGPEVKANIAAYYAMITHLDEQIGRVLNKLEEKGLAENTIIVFAGDNGLAVGQHGLMGKQNLYEHSINVPLIFKGSGIPKGKQTDALAYLSDLYPTFCDLGKTEIPGTVEGKSLLPSIQKDAITNRESMFFAYKNFQRAARNDRWKIIKYNVGDTITTQLFDLKNDPFETTNLAQSQEHEGALKSMENLLKNLMVTYNDEANLDLPHWGVPVLPAWKNKTDKETVEYLRELAEKERNARGFGL